MLTSVRGLVAASVIAGSLLASAPAFAQDEEKTSELTVTGSAAVTSDYRFRGVSLSGGDPAIQGGITVTHSSGFYAGAWGSNIEGANKTVVLDNGAGVPTSYRNGSFGSIELDLFAGWSREVSSGVTVDVGLLYYLYPNAVNTTAIQGAPGPSGLPRFLGFNNFDTDYFEPYASIAGQIGPAKVKVGAAYAWEQDALGGNDNIYVYSNVDVGIPNTPITVSGHLGYTDGVLAPPFLSGTADDSGFDWSIGASATLFGPLSVSVSYVGTEGPNVNNFTDDAIVGTLTAAF